MLVGNALLLCVNTLKNLIIKSLSPVAILLALFFTDFPAYAEGMAMNIDAVESEIAGQPSVADKTEAQVEEVEDKTKSNPVEAEKPPAEPETRLKL